MDRHPTYYVDTLIHVCTPVLQGPHAQECKNIQDGALDTVPTTAFSLIDIQSDQLIQAVLDSSYRKHLLFKHFPALRKEMSLAPGIHSK